ncbi:MAG: sulfatase [Verrucomicrobiales bacterium]|nr:sulfatase [Verrucomicrobiales bacterium]
MKRSRIQLFLVATIGFLASFAQADERPNFVFFITDDIGWNDLGCYGNTFVKTPHLDAMAEQGLRFTNAYLTISSCSPSRCSIISSRYPHNTGAPELHTSLPDDQFRFPKALRDAGYYTVLSGKNHIAKLAETFETISRGKGPGKSDDWVQLLKDRPKDKPFFAWFGSADAHRDWQIDDKNHVYDPERIEVPPFLFDGPKTRQDLADYYHEVSRTDTTMGELVAELKRQGIEDNTYVIYMTDNGRPFPRCKTRLYDSGIKSPFLMACPGRLKPAVVESLISSIDVGPTILELAGVSLDERAQGVSFVPILKDPKATVREVAFAEQNWHVFQAHQRMVRTGDFLYIRNAFPDKLAVSMESDPTFPSGEELWKKRATGELNDDQKDIFQKPRPKEELYQVSDDPYQFTNLAGKEEFAEMMEDLRGILHDWTQATGDTVPENPTPDRQRLDGKKFPGHKHQEMPGAAAGATKINATGPVKLP